MATNPVISMVQAFFITASLCLGGNPGYTDVFLGWDSLLTQRLMGISMWSKDKKKGHKEYGITPISTF